MEQEQPLNRQQRRKMQKQQKKNKASNNKKDQAISYNGNNNSTFNNIQKNQKPNDDQYLRKIKEQIRQIINGDGQEDTIPQYNKPIVQIYYDQCTIQLNFLKKAQSDLEVIRQALYPLHFFLSQHKTSWMLFLVAPKLEACVKSINKLVKGWNFPTLANNWMKREQYLQQYFGKEKIFKKLQKQCCVCLESQNPKFLGCCGSTVCQLCQYKYQTHQCPICRHTLESIQIYDFIDFQELKDHLPNCHIVESSKQDSTDKFKKLYDQFFREQK